MTEALQAQPSRDTAAGVDALLAEAWACRHESVPRAEALLQQALRAAQNIDYRRGQAYAILRLALCGHMRRQDPQLVDSSLQLALGMLREMHDRAGQAEAFNLQANLLSTSGHAEQALEVHRQALALRQALNDRSGEAGSLLNMANELLDLGRTQEAIDHVRQSMAAARECRDTAGLAYAHNTLASAFRQLEDWPSALAALEEALRLVRRTQVRALECTVMTQRGLVLHRLVRKQEARTCLDAALALAQATGHRQPG